MYSLVLMATLSMGPATPAHCWHSCSGCYGCYGCYGCSGGCHGCYGCYGCHGCYGCYGCYGCHGCYGGGYSCYSCYSSCYGCYGCVGCYGGCYGCYGAVYAAPPPPAAPPAAPAKPAAPAPVPKPAEPKKVGETPARARVIVQVPADATLTIDEQPTRSSTSATRSFATPELTPGLKYFYDLKAEVVRDGKTMSETRRILVHAGAEVHTSLLGNAKEAGVAAK